MLDSFDHALLDLVQIDNRMSYEALGAKIGLSASSCRRRLAAMRKSGIIIADIAVIDPAMVGLHITLHALVTLNRDAEEAHRLFRNMVARTAEIVACTYVTGPADYLVTIEVASMADYDALTNALMDGLPVKRMETMVEMRKIKRGRHHPRV